jgi:hypothetical protein
MRMERSVRFWLAARSAIVPLMSPSSQERAEAMASSKRSGSSDSILRPWPSGKLGIRIARGAFEAGLVQGTDKVSVACGSLRS